MGHWCNLITFSHFWPTTPFQTHSKVFYPMGVFWIGSTEKGFHFLFLGLCEGLARLSPENRHASTILKGLPSRPAMTTAYARRFGHVTLKSTYEWLALLTGRVLHSFGLAEAVPEVSANASTHSRLGDIGQVVNGLPSDIVARQNELGMVICWDTFHIFPLCGFVGNPTTELLESKLLPFQGQPSWVSQITYPRPWA